MRFFGLSVFICVRFFVCECSVAGSRKKNFFFEHPFLQLVPVLLGWSVLEGVQCLQSQSKRLLILYGETLTS